MKPTSILISLCILVLVSFYTISEANSKSGVTQRQEDLITACKVLKDVTASSDPQTEQANIIVYRNTYKLLRKKVADNNQLQAEDGFFQALEAGNGDQAVVISLKSGPRPVKGWTHMEIDSLLNEIETKGLKPEDIRTTIILKDTFDIKQRTDISPSVVRP